MRIFRLKTCKNASRVVHLKASDVLIGSTMLVKPGEQVKPARPNVMLLNLGWLSCNVLAGFRVKAGVNTLHRKLLHAAAAFLVLLRAALRRRALHCHFKFPGRLTPWLVQVPPNGDIVCDEARVVRPIMVTTSS